MTFDSGGISIKPSAEMGLMRGDMGGAAVVAATVYAAARLKLPTRSVVSTFNLVLIMAMNYYVHVLCVCVSLCLSVSLSACVCVSVCLSVCLSV